MEELVPAEIAEQLDIGGIADAVWQYSLGEITSYNLTIEVAVSLIILDQGPIYHSYRTEISSQ